MSLNWKEIDLILSELCLQNSSIQKIRQPDFRTLVLDLYKPKRRFSLLISLAQGKTRLHSISRPVKNQVPLQRFAQMLRSRIQGGRITSAEQIGRERIVRVDIQRAGEQTILFLRLWGGAGNVIAADQDFTILDAFYRRPKRGEISGQYFNPQELIETTRARRTQKDQEFQVRPYGEAHGEPCGETAGFNRFIEDQYRRQEEDEELDRLEEKVRGLIERQRRFMEDKLEELRDSCASESEIERSKQIGDILMAHLHEIPPKSDRVQCPDFYHNEETVEIPLDPSLNGQQNAEKYYQRYRKAHRKNERLREEISNLEESLRSLGDEGEQLFSIEDPGEKLKAFQSFLEAYQPVKGGEKKKTVTGLRFTSGPFTILVGRSAQENDSLLRQYVRGNDYWLHTRDYPGGYVFIKHISGKSVPLDTLLDAGNLALHYSRGRPAGKAELYYTQVKYLRRAKEGKKGLVIPTHEKNLSIQLDEKRLEHLLGHAER